MDRPRGVRLLRARAPDPAHRSGQGWTSRLDFIGRNVWFVALFVMLTILHLSVFTGGRMNARAATAISLCPVLVIVVPLVQDRSGVYDERTALGHRRRHRRGARLLGPARPLAVPPQSRGHEDKAWRGAGASVLLATAAWVALLFTTSTVVAAATWLNGPGHGVDDLVSRVDVPEGQVAPHDDRPGQRAEHPQLRRDRRRHPRRRPGDRRGDVAARSARGRWR